LDIIKPFAYCIQGVTKNRCS